MAGDAPSRAMKSFLDYPEAPLPMRRLDLRGGRLPGVPVTGGWAKRATDIVLAAVALALLSPLMLIIAVLSRYATGVSPIFAHPRIGHGGRTFQCYKFRTMVPVTVEAFQRFLDANPEAKHEWQETQKLRQDPRVTPIGQLLRKSSLDELPQLYNVLIGDMSIVGPRPIVADELARYGAYQVEYMRTRPGITGLWQVSGRSGLSYRERVALDRCYVRRWSWLFDLVIMLRTVPALLDHDKTS